VNRRFLFNILIAVSLTSCLIWIAGCITPRRGLAAAGKMQPFDAIIVPGIPFQNGSWDSVMKARVLWSWILYKDGYAKNIIYSGGSVYSAYTEAVIMGLYGEKLGIPREHIFCDTAARHSTENVYYSYLLARQQGFKTIALATDPFQSFLLRGFTRRRFMTPIYHIPFVTDSLAKYNYLNPVIDPQSAFNPNFVSIMKEKSFRQRFRGTMGKDIDWSRHPGNVVEEL
jgi:uncharacterized SAM-binding protein YcdF (DUF218 family)